ncbi:MAG: methyl-accepting chemotaxis protein [Undibacterium sp.]|nr:methyl-accepting chemotaxis protein [Undibacterium sp.]
MQWNSMKLSVKMPLVFMAILLLIAAAAVTGFLQLSRALDTFSTDVAAANQQERQVRLMSLAFQGQVQEWKNVLLRGKDPAQLEKYWGAFQEKEKEVADSANYLKERVSSPDSKALIQKFATAHATMGQNYRKGLVAFKEADFAYDKGDNAVKGMDREPAKLIKEASDDIAKSAATISEATMLASGKAKTLSLSIIAVVLVLGCVVGVIGCRTITRPLGEALMVAQTVSSGDLTSHIEVSRQDEIGLLMAALKEMNESLSQRIGEVRQGIETIASASTQIASGNLDLSARTEAQAGALEETASSMEELTSAVKQNADNAGQANRLALTASGVADKGGAVVAEVIDTMQAINVSSQKIVDIISVIDGIAFQTNILALNAAVEAARAGEQGRGFAVVASEVRNLAQRSASAAKEIKTLITDSVERVATGTRLVNQAGGTMQEIVDSIKRVTDIMGGIASANQEQTAGIEQINQAIMQMDDITQQNAALVEQAAAAAKSMEDQASQLTHAVSIFSLNAAFSSHQAKAIAGHNVMNPMRTITQKKIKFQA